jgi:molybdate transport system substrate-binding protein
MRWRAALPVPVALAVAAIALAVALALAGCKPSASGASGPELLVAAAASLRGVMPDLVTAFTTERGEARLTVTYGASGDLRQQVEGGAPIDVVVFANARTVEDLIKAQLADGATRRVVASNALVLIGPRGAKRYTFATLDTVLAGEKIAIGNPKSVPAGQYAETSLRALGKWDAIQDRLVLAGDVSGVLAYVRHGEVSAGIVYKTEIHGIPDVDVLDELAQGAGERPVVVAAVTTGSKQAEAARAFVAFLGSPAAQGILTAHGFGPQ